MAIHSGHLRKGDGGATGERGTSIKVGSESEETLPLVDKNLPCHARSHHCPGNHFLFPTPDSSEVCNCVSTSESNMLPDGKVWKAKKKLPNYTSGSSIKRLVVTALLQLHLPSTLCYMLLPPNWTINWHTTWMLISSVSKLAGAAN